MKRKGETGFLTEKNPMAHRNKCVETPNPNSNIFVEITVKYKDNTHTHTHTHT